MESKLAALLYEAGHWEPETVTALDCSKRKLSKLEGLLDRCTHLERLDVSNNSLVNLEGLRECVELVALHAKGNKINSLTALSSCSKLKEVHLEDNEIASVKDLQPLEELESLTILSLEGNPVTQSATFIEDISKLLPSLKVLNHMLMTSMEVSMMLASGGSEWLCFSWMTAPSP